MIDHLDETGQPCARHVPSTEGMLAWAAMGARISGFHHDSASKLQSMMMALDEATDLIGDDRPDIRRALDTAMTSLRELTGLLSENRQLAKVPHRKLVPLAEVLGKASARQGVRISGEPSTATVFVAPPSIVHALALLCDQAAGPVAGARAVASTVSVADDFVTIELAGTVASKPTQTTSEAIAVATFLIVREEGSLRCTPRGFIVQLPTRARSPGDKS